MTLARRNPNRISRAAGAVGAAEGFAPLAALAVGAGGQAGDNKGKGKQSHGGALLWL